MKNGPPNHILGLGQLLPPPHTEARAVLIIALHGLAHRSHPEIVLCQQIEEMSMRQENEQNETKNSEKRAFNKPNCSASARETSSSSPKESNYEEYKQFRICLLLLSSSSFPKTLLCVTQGPRNFSEHSFQIVITVRAQQAEANNT